MNAGSEASQGDKDEMGRVLPTDRSDVQMCTCMIASWIAMIMGFHSPQPSRSWCAHVETVDRPINVFVLKFALDDPFGRSTVYT